MDLYGISEARASGSALSLQRQQLDDQILTARDTINNSLDREKITDVAGVKDAKQAQSQDKLLYEFHDAIATAGVGQGVSRISQSVNAYNKVRATGEGVGSSIVKSQRDVAVENNPKLKGVFGDATTPTQSKTPASAPPAAAEGDAAPAAAAAPAEGGDESSVGKKISSAVGGAEGELEEGESIASKAKGAVGTASLGLKAVGAVGGAVSAYELYKNGLAKNADGSDDTLKDVSEISGVVGTGLDILGAFIPVLEPLGAIATGISAVTNTIDSYNTDSSKITDAQNTVTSVETRRKSQLSALPQSAPKAPVNELVGGGLIATGSQHIQTATQGSGAF
jgi:uncharacterized phage infection (PIP) family protein YhgE